MLKHIWSVLCRRSVIDSDTNNISIYDIFEQLAVDVSVSTNHPVPKQINIPIEYEVVSMWLKEDKEKEAKANIEIEIENPEGKKEKSFQQAIEIPVGMRRLRSRVKISGFVITMAGDYIFRVKIKEEGTEEAKVVAELPLEVNLKQVTQKTPN